MSCNRNLQNAESQVLSFMYQRRRAIENLLVLVFDLLALFFSFLFAVLLRYRTIDWAKAEGNQSQQIILMIILYVALNMLTNYYTNFFKRKNGEEFWAIIKEEVVFYPLLLVAYFLMHATSTLSRLVILYMAIIQTCLTYLFRYLLKQYMMKAYKNGRFVNHMILISTTRESAQIIRRLHSNPDWNSVLIGLILVDTNETGATVEGVRVVAGRDSLLDYIIHHDVDEVFFSYEGIEKDLKSREWIQEIQMTGILVDVNIEVFNLVDNGTKTLNRVGNYAVVSFVRNVIPIRGLIFKRLMDIIGSLVGMIILGIVSVILVPAIRLDSPGPAVFSQIRVGKNGRKFRLYKFRSMYVGAEAQKSQLMQQNEMSGPMFKVEDDPRITRIGKWLRSTSLDELPQFWNVLKGDMSLVGTRPPTVDEFEQYTAMHKARLSMTPGLTGMWQTSGRSDIKDFDDILRMDMEYIDNWSIGLDIRILAKTILVVFERKGAQ